MCDIRQDKQAIQDIVQWSTNVQQMAVGKDGNDESRGVPEREGV